MRSLFSVFLLVLLSATTGSAQELTDEEVLRRLEEQLGPPRGLRLVTQSGGENGGEGGTTVTTVEDGLTDLSNLRDDTAIRVDPALEVNVRINFEFDSAALSASEQPALEQMCRVIKKTEKVEKFLIIGHTDSAGSDDYNKRLSQLRAEEVGRHLINDCGIAASRLEMVGYGEQFPKNEADTRAPENRRVEFQALS